MELLKMALHLIHCSHFPSLLLPPIMINYHTNVINIQKLVCCQFFPTQMVMVGRYTNYLRRCRGSFIQCILDEVLFEILLRLPAQGIYFGARLVCRGMI
ncbi:hypothetical protein OROHE_010917 [Orobanche hederae]